MARQAEGGYMQWPAAPRWMEPLLADDAAGGQMVTVSRLANADLDRLRAGPGGAGLRREDLRYPVAPRGKYQVSQGAFPQNDGQDRLIPGDGKTLYMSCGQPTKYLPRRRKLPPRIVDNRIMTFNYEDGNSATSIAGPAAAAAAAAAAAPAGASSWLAGSRAPDVSSVTGRHYSRRRMIQPQQGFFGFQGQPIDQSSNQSLRRVMFGEKI